MEKKVELHGIPERISGGFLKVDRYSVSYSAYRGGMCGPYPREVMERGDAAAMLAHDPRLDLVVLVEQFRLPAHLREPGSGWVLETVAGMIAQGDSPKATIVRECEEETGLVPQNLHEIGTVYPTVGGSTERIVLFYGEVDASGLGQDTIAGADEGEDIRVVTMPRGELIAQARAGVIRDAKLQICALWMADRSRS
ncbi:MAG: NUDIX hydrolase [Hyphomonadaceae bacterium]|nr:NUDIX hydrolase [Hyphomonadaceae bacterium]